MKRIIILIALINLTLSSNSQEIDREKEWDIRTQFETDWMYFRMLKNPLIPDNEKFVDNSWANPYNMFLPEKMRKEDYRAEIKISKWGKTVSYFYNEIWQFNGDDDFYLVEKKDGYTGIKKSYFPEAILDSMQLNVYDSIFPYDNRFLARYLGKTKGGEYKFSFYSGNVQWGEWKDVGYRRTIEVVGYIRGVQFGIENVLRFQQEFSDKIKLFRPEYPNYVYTSNRWSSLLTKACVIIGAPEGKEDQLVEYIYYSNDVDKTGDADETHYYEMRYILPTQIESIKERRLEKRRLTDDEQQYILNRENEMYFFVERNEWKKPDVQIVIDREKDSVPK